MQRTQIPHRIDPARTGGGYPEQTSLVRLRVLPSVVRIDYPSRRIEL